MQPIYIIANFSGDLDNKVNGRFTYLAGMLSLQGWDITLITSDFDHRKKSIRTSIADSYRFKIVCLHEPGYNSNISIKRLYSHWRWGSAVRKFLMSSTTPSCIYCAVPSLSAAKTAANFCRSHGVRFIVDVQDLWPEAFAIAVKNPILRVIFIPFKRLADSIYRSADRIVAVSETYANRALSVNRKTSSGLSIYLGNDGTVFDKARENHKVSRPSREIWIAYVGTVGYSYDLKCIIDAIRICKNDVSMKIKFIVIGDGPLRGKYEKYAEECGIHYDFTGMLPYERMAGLLCSCDIAVNAIVKGGAQSITNKIGDYALAGLPVINTQECQEYRDLIAKYRIGINCDAGNAQQCADALRLLIANPEMRGEMGRAARKFGIEHFDRRNSYPKIVDMIARYTSIS